MLGTSLPGPGPGESDCRSDMSPVNNTNSEVESTHVHNFCPLFEFPFSKLPHPLNLEPFGSFHPSFLADSLRLKKTQSIRINNLDLKYSLAQFIKSLSFLKFLSK